MKKYIRVDNSNIFVSNEALRAKGIWFIFAAYMNLIKFIVILLFAHLCWR